MGNTASAQVPMGGNPFAVRTAYAECASKKAASGTTETAGADAKDGAEKPKLKICCACPETRKVRDECGLLNGEDKCKDAIEAHKACLRTLGFKV